MTDQPKALRIAQRLEEDEAAMLNPDSLTLRAARLLREQHEEIEWLLIENKRLRFECGVLIEKQKINADCDVAAREPIDQHAEIERLREQLRLANIDALNETGENERLRGALKGIETLKVTIDGVPATAYQTEGWMRELAREALEVKS